MHTIIYDTVILGL